jgi:hypothetical protein
MDIEIAPAYPDSQHRGWDPWRLRLVPVTEPQPLVTELVRLPIAGEIITIWQIDGDQYVDWVKRGTRKRLHGAQKLRLGIVANAPGPQIVLTYIFNVLGTINFPLSQAPRKTAWKDQPAQAFEGLNTHIQALDITEEAPAHIDSQTKAYVSPRDGTSSAKTAHDNPKAEKDSTSDAAPALSALSMVIQRLNTEERSDTNDGHAATPKRESMQPEEKKQNNSVTAPTKPMANRKKRGTTQTPPGEYEPIAVFDVYSMISEDFEPPPIDGLDVRNFGPVSSLVLPDRFGSLVYEPPGLDAPEPATLNFLKRATYVYRIAVKAEPETHRLEHLARSLTTASSLAREVNGLIRDVATARIMTADDARRILKSDAFDIRDHLNIAEYGSETITLQTLGLAKFGRADIVVRDIPKSQTTLVKDALWTLLDALAAGEVVTTETTINLGASPVRFLREDNCLPHQSKYGALRIVDAHTDRTTAKHELHEWLKINLAYN